MFDMRYHIASLVAVFLALTVGLLLGSLIIDKSVLVDQQEKLASSIKADISKIREENAHLRERNRKLQVFTNQVLPAAVRRRLDGRKIATVVLTDRQDASAADIAHVVDLAGGVNVPVKINLEKLDFSNKTLVGDLSEILDTSSTGGGFEREFWARLAAELTTPGESPNLIDKLASNGLIRVDTQFLPVDHIVLTAPDKKTTGNRDVLFLEALAQTKNARVIGVEASDNKPSRIPVYKLRNVGTVDDIEVAAGKISLINLLEDPTLTGHFGAKSTADKLMP